MDVYKYKSVDEYISHMPAGHVEKLQLIRSTIKEAIPEAEEVISYNMPAYKFKRVLVYFALAKKHIGFYPTPSAITAFTDQLIGFKQAKGSVQFPLNQELPLDLIAEMAKYRFREEQARSK